MRPDWVDAGGDLRAPDSWSTADVGGAFDGALAVWVTDPPSTAAPPTPALAAVAAATGVPRRSVRLVRGTRSRRKLIEIDVGPEEGAQIEHALARLRDGAR